MTAPTATSALAGLRIAVGAGAYASPALAGTLFGFEPKRNPQSPYLATSRACSASATSARLERGLRGFTG